MWIFLCVLGAAIAVGMAYGVCKKTKSKDNPIKVALIDKNLGITEVVLLNFETILEWFRLKQHLVEKDKDNIAFTLTEKLDNGEFTVVAGIFNKSTAKFEIDENGETAAQTFHAKELDEKLSKYHEKEELVIYQ